MLRACYLTSPRFASFPSVRTAKTYRWSTTEKHVDRPHFFWCRTRQLFLIDFVQIFVINFRNKCCDDLKKNLWPDLTFYDPFEKNHKQVENFFRQLFDSRSSPPLHSDGSGERNFFRFVLQIFTCELRDCALLNLHVIPEFLQELLKTCRLLSVEDWLPLLLDLLKNFICFNSIRFLHQFHSFALVFLIFNQDRGNWWSSSLLGEV